MSCRSITALGKTLRKIRVDEGYRLADMADILAVSPSFLSAVELGRKNPSRRLVENLKHTYAGHPEIDALAVAATYTAEQVKPLVEALRDLLEFAEDAEVKMLVGDEGCLWPVEIARDALKQFGEG